MWAVWRWGIQDNTKQQEIKKTMKVISLKNGEDDSQMYKFHTQLYYIIFLWQGIPIMIDKKKKKKRYLPVLAFKSLKAQKQFL